MPPSDDDDDLCAARDLVVRRLRALPVLLSEHLPTDVPLSGILGRARELLEAHLPALEALEALDLSRPAAGRTAQAEVVAALNRALHLPRMVLAMGRVVQQETKRRSLDPVEAEARRAAGAVHALAQRWLVRQATSPEGLDPGEDEDEDEGAGDDPYVV